jgi:hypothetical protein
MPFQTKSLISLSIATSPVTGGVSSVVASSLQLKVKAANTSSHKKFEFLNIGIKYFSKITNVQQKRKRVKQELAILD